MENPTLFPAPQHTLGGLAHAECRRRQFKVLVHLFQKVMGEVADEGNALALGIEVEIPGIDNYESLSFGWFGACRRNNKGLVFQVVYEDNWSVKPDPTGNAKKQPFRTVLNQLL